jgi:hypothetical protein
VASRISIALFLFLATSAILAPSSTALAQSERGDNYFKEPVRAPRQTIELAVQSHLVQGVGLSAQGVRATDLSQDGLGFGFLAGYRFSPTFLLGITGRYDEFAPGERLSNGGSVHGLVAGASGVWHFLPSGRIDPWLLGGVGYRMLWLVGEMPGHDELWHGPELARVLFGVDFRLSDRFAFGPQFGGDVSMFAWQQLEGREQPILGRRPELFLETGFQARFELTATHDAQPAQQTSSSGPAGAR